MKPITLKRTPRPAAPPPASAPAATAPYCLRRAPAGSGLALYRGDALIGLHARARRIGPGRVEVEYLPAGAEAGARVVHTMPARLLRRAV
jgi:hypothetical protein